MSLRVGTTRSGPASVPAMPMLWKRSRALELVACCGRDIDGTREFAGPRGAASYADYEAMLAHERLDLLIVALPPFAHDGQVELAG